MRDASGRWRFLDGCRAATWCYTWSVERSCRRYYTMFVYECRLLAVRSAEPQSTEACAWRTW
jgi:hypothetical protein